MSRRSVEEWFRQLRPSDQMAVIFFGSLAAAQLLVAGIVALGLVIV